LCTRSRCRRNAPRHRLRRCPYQLERSEFIFSEIVYLDRHPTVAGLDDPSIPEYSALAQAMMPYRRLIRSSRALSDRRDRSTPIHIDDDACENEILESRSHILPCERAEWVPSPIGRIGEDLPFEDEVHRVRG
jgi:hypothetical protein